MRHLPTREYIIYNYSPRGQILDKIQNTSQSMVLQRANHEANIGDYYIALLQRKALTLLSRKWAARRAIVRNQVCSRFLQAQQAPNKQTSQQLASMITLLPTPTHHLKDIFTCEMLASDRKSILKASIGIYTNFKPQSK